MPPARSNSSDLARRRAIAVGAGLAVVILLGLFVSQCGGGGGRQAAADYSAAWERQDFGAMYDQLSDDSKRQIGRDAFIEAQRRGLSTATVRTLKAGEAEDFRDGSVKVPFEVDTRIFGKLKLNAVIPVTSDDDGAKVVWKPYLVMPGVNPGETLTRATTMPERASILAADGTPLAEGPDRTSPIPDVAAEIAGSFGAPKPGTEDALSAFGYPPGTKVGLTGLERVFQQRLAGRPGGTLRAGSRVLATSSPAAARPLKTTIIPSVERAAATALAGRAGGVAVMNPKTGEVMALAGSAFSSTAPPGSTFKIITAVAGLEAGATTPSTTYPIETQATLDGVPLQNAGGESCGGTLVQSFANSCNSVFAPLGAKVGAEKLVATAEKFGFNRPMPGIPGAALNTIPHADAIHGPLDVGSTAIGQGEVMASALGMATTAAAIANGGFRSQPTLLPTSRPTGWQATTRRVAGQMRELMLAVVRYGTGGSAAISGVPVAGKTGTAELVDTTSPNVEAGDPRNTDAWFVAFAPAFRPRVAVGVELDGAGHGGDTAAPVAHDAMLAALQATR